jgi:hypothetical protein
MQHPKAHLISQYVVILLVSEKVVLQGWKEVG